MAKLTPETLVEELKKLCGGNLLSVVLYGSASAGDHAGKRSDYNLLVVAVNLDAAVLRKLSSLTVKWVGQGNPPPVFFTAERFRSSADAFAIEIADMKENHKVLFGIDPLSELKPGVENFRLQLEHELKAKLIRLRQKFLLTEGKPKLVQELMLSSLSSFLILFKNALRLYNAAPPAKKLDALAELSRHIYFDHEVFVALDRLKRGEKIKDLDPLALFDRYLKAVEKVVDEIDKHMGKSKEAVA